MSATATVSSKFQISVPKEVREQMALRPGEKIAFIAKPEGFRIVPAPKREEFAGMARGANIEAIATETIGLLKSPETMRLQWPMRSSTRQPSPWAPTC